MSKALFWTSAAAVLYTYLLYPLWLYLRSRYAPNPWTQSECTPTVSIILAVRNGAPLIAKKIDDLLAIDYPREKMEFVVVSDGSVDGTNDILRSLPHPDVRSVILDEHQGKAAALNAAMAEATGEILVFMDLRPAPERDALRKLVANFADPTVGCVGGEFCLRSNGVDGTTAAVGNLYWRYEQWMRLCEAAFDSTTSVAGCFYAVRRGLAHEFPPGLILDDMYQPLWVAYQGYRSVIDSGARVWDALPSKVSGEFRRKVRTLAGNFQLLQLAPWILSVKNRLLWQLLSHKLLRLLMPLCLALLIVNAYLLRAQVFYGAVLILQLGFYAAALLGLVNSAKLSRITGPASAFAVLNAAAVAGLWTFAFHRGPLWKIWMADGAPATLGHCEDSASQSLKAEARVHAQVSSQIR